MKTIRNVKRTKLLVGIIFLAILATVIIGIYRDSQIFADNSIYIRCPNYDYCGEERCRIVPKNNGTHLQSCPTCNKVSDTIEECSGATHDNGGVCQYCQVQYEQHYTSDVFVKWIKEDDRHIPLYACTFEGCEGLHYPSDTSEYTYTTECMSSGIYIRTDYNENGCWPVYICEVEGCDGEAVGEEKAHRGGTHLNGGKCTNCGYQYQSHEESRNITYQDISIENDETISSVTQHIKYVECTETSCDYVYTTIENHYFGINGTDGECACGEQHSSSTHLYTWINCNENYHWQECYICGTASTATAGSHTFDDNNICTNCGYYAGIETHQYVWVYNPNGVENSHIMQCKYCEHPVTASAGNHTFDTNHICTICGAACTHNYEWVNLGDGGHVMRCKYCENEIGLSAIHFYNIKYNEDKTIHWEECDCGETIEHSKGERAKYYFHYCHGGHSLKYLCATEGCTGIFIGEKEDHTINENGTCDVCGGKAHYEVLEHNDTTQTALEAGEENVPGYCTNCEKTIVTHTKSTEPIYEGHPMYNGKHRVYYECETEYSCTYSNCTNENCEHKASVADTCDYRYGGQIENCTYENGKCTLCGICEEHQFTYLSNSDGTHDLSCEGCGFTREGIDCTYAYENYDENTHVERCKHCKEEKSGAQKENHNYEYTDNEDGNTHTKTCTICEYQNTEEHNYVDSECVCGAERASVECDHNYEVKWNDSEHWEECTGCGDKKTAVVHTYENYTNNGDGTHSRNCTGCEHKVTDNHSSVANKDNDYHWTECNECDYASEKTAHAYGNYTNNEDGTHSRNCTGCEHKETNNHSSVTDKDSNHHWTKCSECDYTSEKIAHTYGSYTNNENETHSRTCTGCEYKETENHNYVDGACDKCGAEEPETECVHTYTIKYNSEKHWEECSKCGEIKAGSNQNHDYGDWNWVSNGNGEHYVTCEMCDNKHGEPCFYEDGECVECGAKEPVTECTHTYITKHNTTSHWKECSECGETKEGSTEPHSYNEYTNNEDDTHSANCTGCEYELTEEHNYEDGLCTKCGVEQPNTEDGKEDPDQDGKEEPEDNTIIEDPLPETGVSSVIIIAIIGVGIVLVINTMKSRKYKDI